MNTFILETLKKRKCDNVVLEEGKEDYGMETELGVSNLLTLPSKDHLVFIENRCYDVGTLLQTLLSLARQQHKTVDDLRRDSGFQDHLRRPIDGKLIDPLLTQAHETKTICLPPFVLSTLHDICVRTRVDAGRLDEGDWLLLRELRDMGFVSPEVMSQIAHLDDSRRHAGKCQEKRGRLQIAAHSCLEREMKMNLNMANLPGIDPLLKIGWYLGSLERVGTLEEIVQRQEQAMDQDLDQNEHGREEVVKIIEKCIQDSFVKFPLQCSPTTLVSDDEK